MKKHWLFTTLIALALCVICCALFSTEAKAASADDLSFWLNDDGKSYSVADCKNTASGTLIIPATYNGKPVTGIANMSFGTAAGPIIHEDFAFGDCKNLTEIIIPDSVTYIGDDSFVCCTNLTKISIPKGVTYIGDRAFWGCANLPQITIPDSVTYIGDDAFYGCSRLTQFQIPDSVTTIGSGAFIGCSSLTGIVIPDGTTSLQSTFMSCTSLTSITIPDGVTTIDAAFYGCTSLTSITIPDSVTTIDAHTFTDCTSLTSITIPDSVTTIGFSAFAGCTSLTSITIPDSVTTIGFSAFEGCTSLSKVTLSKNLKVISESMFADCTSLTSIVIPDSVTTIETTAFARCSRLKNVEFGSGLTTIGASAFINCSSLTTVNLPKSTTTISEGAFFECTGLTTINIPKGTDVIEFMLFYGCTALKEIYIPDTIEDIYNYAFFNCLALTDVYFTGTQSQWDAYSFGRWNNRLYEVTVHCNSNCNSGHKYTDGMDTMCNRCGETRTIKLATPTVTAVNATAGVKVTWNAISGAKSYNVYRSVYSGGKWGSWTKIKTGVTGTTYMDSAVKSSTNVKYTVRAVNGDFTSSYKGGNSLKYLATPTVTAVNATAGVKVTWNAISGAKSYNVYRSVYSGGKWGSWTKIKTGVTGTTYMDSAVKSSTNVKYTVRAVNGDFTSSYKGGNSLKYLATPTVTAVNATAGVKVTWNKISGAKSYNVYRSVYSGGKWGSWTKIKTGVTGTTYMDSAVKSSTNVKYTVRAVNGDFTSSYKGGNSLKYLATPTVKTTKATDGVKVNWNQSIGAKEYIVYRRTYANGKWSGWTKLTVTSACSFTDKTAKKGVYYQYTVCARNGNYKSSYKNSDSIKR